MHLTFNVRNASRGMPEPRDLYDMSCVVQPIDYSIRSDDYFPNKGLTKFGNFASEFGKLREYFRLADQKLSERNRLLRRI